MKRYTKRYLVGKKSTILNVRMVKGAEVYLNGLLLQHGFDYVKRKRNIKFTIPLECGDEITIEEKA